MGLEAESKMRVASLESVLAVATLVSAIVIVLWGIKIFHGVWTGRNSRRNKKPFKSKRFASVASLPRRRKPCRSVWRRSVRQPLGASDDWQRHLSGVGSLSSSCRFAGVSVPSRSQAAWQVWRFFKSVAEKIHGGATKTKTAENHWRRIETRFKVEASHHQWVLSLVSGPAPNGAGRKNIWCKALMHFGFYLMIAALVLMGLEVVYALYQLASFVL
jgi:hypothetical protein